MVILMVGPASSGGHLKLKKQLQNAKRLFNENRNVYLQNFPLGASHPWLSGNPFPWCVLHCVHI